MGLFRYEAVDKTGKVVRGAMNARDESAVAQALAAKGYAARGIQAAHASSAGMAAAPRAAAVRPAAQQALPVSVNTVASCSVLAMFFRHLATMVRAGMPLTQSLTEAAGVVRDRHLARALPEMVAAVNAGRSLSSAMAAFPSVFPVYATSAIWCGELAGRLETALDDIATEMEQEASDTRYGRVGWGLTKISLVGLALSLPLLNMRALLAPMIDDIAGNGGQEGFGVPAFLQRILPSLLYVGLPIAVLMIVLWIAWGHIKRIGPVRQVLDTVLLRSACWGRLHRARSLSRVLRYMDMLYASGVSPATAWDAATLTARNNDIAYRLRSVRESAGRSTVSQLFNMAGVLAMEDVALIAGAEKAGDLPATLGRLANMYASEAEAHRATGRIWSLSMVTAVQIAIGGAAIIYMASSYGKALMKLMGY